LACRKLDLQDLQTLLDKAQLTNDEKWELIATQFVLCLKGTSEDLQTLLRKGELKPDEQWKIFKQLYQEHLKGSPSIEDIATAKKLFRLAKINNLGDDKITKLLGVSKKDAAIARDLTAIAKTPEEVVPSASPRTRPSVSIQTQQRDFIR